jgi:rhodanese-related sulfurtransferase
MPIARITVAELATRLARGERATFVDARSASAYPSATEQLPGSVRISPDADAAKLAAPLPRDSLTVAYCTCPAEHSSVRVALQLRRVGFGDAFALAGGFDAWRNAGLPLDPVRSTAEAREAGIQHQPM